MNLLFQFLLLFNWVKYERMAYAGELYPLWAEGLGWTMALVPVILILSLSVYKLTRVPESKSGRDKNFFAVRFILKILFL